MSRLEKLNEWLLVTIPAHDGWIEQAKKTDSATDPLAAYNQAVDVTDPDGFGADEVRWHSDAEVALLRRKYRLIAVIGLDELSPTQRQTIADVDNRVQGPEGAA